MPPKRSESWQKSANQEGRIQLALNDIKSGRIQSLRAAAKLYDLPLTTLHRRTNGVSSRVDTYHHRRKMTQLEEDSLVEWVLSMDSRGAAPRPATIREMANILLATRGANPPLTVSENWVLSFINRQDRLQSRYSKRYDY